MSSQPNADVLRILTTLRVRLSILLVRSRRLLCCAFVDPSSEAHAGLSLLGIETVATHSRNVDARMAPVARGHSRKHPDGQTSQLVTSVPFMFETPPLVVTHTVEEPVSPYQSHRSTCTAGDGARLHNLNVLLAAQGVRRHDGVGEGSGIGPTSTLLAPRRDLRPPIPETVAVDTAVPLPGLLPMIAAGPEQSDSLSDTGLRPLQLGATDLTSGRKGASARSSNGQGCRHCHCGDHRESKRELATTHASPSC